MCGNEINFFEGERKEIKATIRSKTPNETVVITSADFELTNRYNGSIVQQGPCEVDGNEAAILLELNEKGNYELKITASVGREVIIEKAVIKAV